jgi:hypothetical protein
MVTPGHVFGEGVNWAKAQEVFTSLLVSPIVGFVCSALLLLLAKFLIRRPELYAPAEAGKSPPWWIRLLLIFTCTGVSFSHGSNDGQKGMGFQMSLPPSPRRRFAMARPSYCGRAVAQRAKAAFGLPTSPTCPQNFFQSGVLRRTRRRTGRDQVLSECYLALC